MPPDTKQQLASQCLLPAASLQHRCSTSCSCQLSILILALGLYPCTVDANTGNLVQATPISFDAIAYGRQQLGLQIDSAVHVLVHHTATAGNAVDTVQYTH